MFTHAHLKQYVPVTHAHTQTYSNMSQSFDLAITSKVTLNQKRKWSLYIHHNKLEQTWYTTANLLISYHYPKYEQGINSKFYVGISIPGMKQIKMELLSNAYLCRRKVEGWSRFFGLVTSLVTSHTPTLFKPLLTMVLHLFHVLQSWCTHEPGTLAF